MPNQNDPTKPPAQPGGTTPVPASTTGGTKSGTQKDVGTPRDQPNGGANRPPQERRADSSRRDLWGPLLGAAPCRTAGC